MRNCVLLIACVLFLNVHRIQSMCPTLPAVTVSGTLVCDGQLPPPLTIHLAQQIGMVSNELGRVSSDENGFFEVTGFPIYVYGGQLDFFLRLGYNINSEKVFLRVQASEYFDVTSGSGRVLMGPLKLTKRSCQAYTVFYEAIVNYFDRTGHKLRTEALISINEETNPLTQSSPYVSFNQVISGKDFDYWTFQLAQHEIGHIVRHINDGDRSHFEEDERLYGDPSLRLHTCSSESSKGFAFNEGWAYFWADQCLESSASGSQTILGDVAAAFRSLQVACDSSYADMVEVLRKNRGIIHSYSEYEEKHTEEFGCP